MTDFRTLSDGVLASPQIHSDDIAVAKKLGVVRIIQNRPDEEEPGQPDSADLEAEAQAQGLEFLRIPIGGSGFSEPQVTAMREALDGADGKVLAFCRSGTRSTLLWSLAQAQGGGDCDAIAKAASAAGYDVSPVRQAMDVLSAQARGAA